MTPNYLIPIPYKGDTYLFIVTREAQIVEVSVSWGNCSRVGEPIDIADVPEAVDELLAETLQGYDFWKEES